jgi:hypothetical protein
MCHETDAHRKPPILNSHNNTLDLLLLHYIGSYENYHLAI